MEFNSIDYCVTQQEDIIYTYKKTNDFLKVVTASYITQTRLSIRMVSKNMNLPLYGHIPLSVFKNL